MPSRILALAIDCLDTEALALFWRRALRYHEPHRWRDAEGLTYVQLDADGEPSLLFQPVGENKCDRDVTDTYASLP